MYSRLSEGVNIVAKNYIMTIGDRTYELLSLWLPSETPYSVWMDGSRVLLRGRLINASLGQDDGQFIYDNRSALPDFLIGKADLIFPLWSNPTNPRYCGYVYGLEGKWYLHWCDLADRRWESGIYFVRRIS